MQRAASAFLKLRRERAGFVRVAPKAGTRETAVWIGAASGDPAHIGSLGFVINTYLFMWPTFSVIYLVWTHIAYSRQGPRALGSRARRENEFQ